MLNSKGFDEWSGEYDEIIKNSKGYPFEGYYDVLGYLQSKVKIFRKLLAQNMEELIIFTLLSFL